MKALNGSQANIIVLNTKITQMHETVLQNRMALDVLTADGTMTNIKNKEEKMYAGSNERHVGITALSSPKERVEKISVEL